jgi:hydroxymethylbilane synthase
MLPAAGQGALGLEIRAARPDLVQAMSFLAHHETWLAVAAERAVSRTMGGSCSMPLAAHAHRQGDQLLIRAAWGDPDEGGELIRAEASGSVQQRAQAEALGIQVAQELKRQGAH